MAGRPFTAIVVSAALVVLTGCITGERPSFDESTAVDAPTGDAAVDAVLEPLTRLDQAVFTATYRITNNFGPVTREATVAQRGDGERSTTIGDVRFLIGDAVASTCVFGGDGPASTACSDGIDDAAISDLQVTHQFAGRSAASRLRTDARRRIGPTDGYEAVLAGQTARCVSIPVAGGSKVYCSLPEGPLASYQGPDLLIELTSFTPGAPDDALFGP